MEKPVQLTYREVETVLAYLHGFEDHRRAALSGRIKHFQRSGWPGNTNTGKGRAAVYGFGAIWRLCLGFELLELGITPERASNLLRINWHNIQTATALAINAHKLFCRDNEPFDVFLYCDPNALQAVVDNDDISDDNFFYTSAPEMSRSLTQFRGMELRRLALINLSRLIGDLVEVLGSSEELKRAYEQWDDEERAN